MYGVPAIYYWTSRSDVKLRCVPSDHVALLLQGRRRRYDTVTSHGLQLGECSRRRLLPGEEVEGLQR